MSQFLRPISDFPRPDYFWLIFLGWFVFSSSFLLISGISMVPTGAPSSTMHLDKVLHLIAYGVLTSGMVFALPKRALPHIFAFCFGVGVILEIMQGTFAIGRTASIFDAIANGAGALIIIFLWMWIWPKLGLNPATQES